MKTLKKLALLITAFGVGQHAYAVEQSDFTINGYFSFEYEKHMSGDEGGDPNGSFDMDLIDLVINFQPTDQLRISTDITWEHGTATEDSQGNAAVEYAFAEYSFSNAFRARVGKMFVPFGIYNELHTAKPATMTVKEPQTTNKNDKVGNDVRFYPRWMTGMAVTGDLVLMDNDFDYIVMIGNGDDPGDAEDINFYEEDTNTHKSLTARARYWLTDDLRVGLSFYDDVSTQYDGDLGPTQVTSIGTEITYTTPSNTYLEFEYVQGTFEFDADAGPGNDIDQDRAGWTAMVSHPVTRTLTPYLRYEVLDPDDDVDDDDFNLTIAGVRYGFAKNAFLKLEIDRYESDDNNAEFAGADFTEFKGSVAIGF